MDLNIGLMNDGVDNVSCPIPSDTPRPAEPDMNEVVPITRGLLIFLVQSLKGLAERVDNLEARLISEDQRL